MYLNHKNQWSKHSWKRKWNNTIFLSFSSGMLESSIFVIQVHLAMYSTVYPFAPTPSPSILTLFLLSISSPPFFYLNILKCPHTGDYLSFSFFLHVPLFLSLFRDIFFEYFLPFLVFHYFTFYLLKKFIVISFHIHCILRQLLQFVILCFDSGRLYFISVFALYFFNKFIVSLPNISTFDLFIEFFKSVYFFGNIIPYLTPVRRSFLFNKWICWNNFF